MQCQRSPTLMSVSQSPTSPNCSVPHIYFIQRIHVAWPYHSVQGCVVVYFTYIACVFLALHIWHSIHTWHMKILDVQLLRACDACTLNVEAIVENATQIPQDTWTSILAAPVSPPPTLRLVVLAKDGSHRSWSSAVSEPFTTELLHGWRRSRQGQAISNAVAPS